MAAMVPSRNVCVWHLDSTQSHAHVEIQWSHYWRDPCTDGKMYGMGHEIVQIRSKEIRQRQQLERWFVSELQQLVVDGDCAHGCGDGVGVWVVLSRDERESGQGDRWWWC